jgi:hypothetical protein
VPRARKVPHAAEIGLPAGGDDQQGRCVEVHPLFGEIYELLRDRFSPETVVHMLQWRYGEALERMPPLPSARTIHRWRRRHMPPGDLLPPSLVGQKLKEMDVKVDLWKALQNAYRLAEDRLHKALITEQTLQGVPLSSTDRAIETVLRVGEQLWKVGQDLGLYPRWGVQVGQVNVYLHVGKETGGGELDDEEIAAVAAALSEKRPGQLRPNPSAAGDVETHSTDRVADLCDCPGDDAGSGSMGKDEERRRWA